VASQDEVLLQVVADTKQAIAALQDMQQKAKEQLDRIGAAADKLDFKPAQEGVRGLRARLAELDGEISGVAAGLATLGGLVTLGKIKDFAEDSTDAALAVERIHLILKQATGSAEEADRTFGFLVEQAKRLGQDIGGGAEEFAKFAVAAKTANIPLEESKKTFIAVNEAAAVFGLTSDQVRGSFYALQQMISKGVVATEELRRQLGERLFGAFQIAAQAMGVTVEKLGDMLAAGEVLASDFIPKFTEQLKTAVAGTLPDAMETARVAIGKVKDDLFLLKAAVGEGIIGAFKEGSASLISDLQGMQEEGKVFGTEIGHVLTGTVELVDVLAKHVDVLKASIAGLGTVSAGLAIAKLVTVFAAMNPVVLAVTAAVGGLAAAMVYSIDRLEKEKQAVIESTHARDQANSILEQSKTLHGEEAKQLAEDTDKRIKNTEAILKQNIARLEQLKIEADALSDASKADPTGDPIARRQDIQLIQDRRDQIERLNLQIANERAELEKLKTAQENLNKVQADTSAQKKQEESHTSLVAGLKKSTEALEEEAKELEAFGKLSTVEAERIRQAAIKLFNDYKEAGEKPEAGLLNLIKHLGELEKSTSKATKNSKELKDQAAELKKQSEELTTALEALAIIQGKAFPDTAPKVSAMSDEVKKLVTELNKLNDQGILSQEDENRITEIDDRLRVLRQNLSDFVAKTPNPALVFKDLPGAAKSAADATASSLQTVKEANDGFVASMRVAYIDAMGAVQKSVADLGTTWQDVNGLCTDLAKNITDIPGFPSSTLETAEQFRTSMADAAKQVAEFPPLPPSSLESVDKFRESLLALGSNDQDTILAHFKVDTDLLSDALSGKLTPAMKAAAEEFKNGAITIKQAEDAAGGAVQVFDSLGNNIETLGQKWHEVSPQFTEGLDTWSSAWSQVEHETKQAATTFDTATHTMTNLATQTGQVIEGLAKKTISWSDAQSGTNAVIEGFKARRADFLVSANAIADAMKATGEQAGDSSTNVSELANKMDKVGRHGEQAFQKINAKGQETLALLGKIEAEAGKVADALAKLGAEL
jgi:tape measure domain-containing protein